MVEEFEESMLGLDLSLGSHVSGDLSMSTAQSLRRGSGSSAVQAGCRPRALGLTHVPPPCCQHDPIGAGVMLHSGSRHFGA